MELKGSKTMNKKFIAMSVTAGLIITTGILYAAGDPVPHTFTANTVAKASEVNANFQDLADRIEANMTTTYDYKTYAVPASVTKKTFTVTSNADGAEFDTEVRTFASSSSGGTDTVTITRKRYLGGVSGEFKHHQDLKYTKTDDKVIFNGRDIFKTSDGTLKTTDTVSPSLTTRTSTMTIGNSWTDGFTFTSDDKTATNADTTTYGIQSMFLAGTETLTVLGVTDVPCLKYHINRKTEGFGTYQQVVWECQGYGTAKVIEVRSDYSYIKTLSAMEM